MTQPTQLVIPPLLEHERRVREMMSGFGQGSPDSPTLRDPTVLLLRCRLILEEALEFVEAAGWQAEVETTADDGTHRRVPVMMSDLVFRQFGIPNLPEMIDAVADLSVVVEGSAAALGVRLAPIYELIDSNNLLKVSTGSVDAHGKFRKAPDHPTPNIEFALRLQGWQPQ